jgi:hypothetical protein
MLIVVGGHSRNIGKTSVVEGLIRALPEAEWTAIKITQHGHGICSAIGEPCECTTEYDHPFAISEETSPNATDSGRFLAAGAKRSFWVRTPIGQLAEAVGDLRRIIAGSGHVIVESNSLLNFIVPDLYLVVLDFSVIDMKDSSRRFLGRADALIVLQEVAQPPWDKIPARWLNSKPRFAAVPGTWVSNDLAAFVADRVRPGKTQGFGMG